MIADRPLLRAVRAAIMSGAHEELRDLYHTMDELEAHKKATEKKISSTITDTPTFRIVTSVPGIGIVTAACVMAEVGDFARFPAPGSLIAYAGIYPRERSSGSRQQFGSISKMGSKVLRYSIIEAAMRVRDTDTSHNLYTHYDAARNKRHKTPKQARVVLAHKILTIMWHLVRRGVVYDDRAVKPAQREMTS